MGQGAYLGMCAILPYCEPLINPADCDELIKKRQLNIFPPMFSVDGEMSAQIIFCAGVNGVNFEHDSTVE